MKYRLFAKKYHKHHHILLYPIQHRLQNVQRVVNQCYTGNKMCVTMKEVMTENCSVKSKGKQNIPALITTLISPRQSF